MKEYNQYVTAVNKIFDYLSKMKAGWQSIDNINYIENIEEYKQAIIKNADIFKSPVSSENEATSDSLEVLGND